MSKDTHCINFAGTCDDVACNVCPERQEFGGRLIEQRLPPRVEGMDYNNNEAPLIRAWAEAPVADDVSLFLPDNVMHPVYYARWTMEPIEFIAINNLPWWLANVIKYTMRFDAKDGLQDLYKARSYLEMKIKELEGVKRFWDKAVTQERALKAKDHLVMDGGLK